ncbi:hypothetical protein Adt_33212 [Abeliophyllum distichum]|uniref:Uncharacterized protein n=1 Tax=Abeliophyllum distichum TaxID=126358 RepID=A0ABD1QVL3_9LAMI
MRVVRPYKNEFSSMPECLRLSNRFMVADGEQLTKRIIEVHLEWDLSFLMSALTDTPTLEPSAATEVPSSTEPQAEGKTRISLLSVEENPKCTSPGEAMGQ